MSDKKGFKMSPAIIQSAIEMVKSISDLTGKVLDAGDPEKLAVSVEKLHGGIAESYSMMRRIVENDEKLSTDEKIKKLEQLAKKEQEAKDDAVKLLEEHRERTAKIALDVLKGFLTCGLSFTPALIVNIKKALDGKEEFDSIEVETGESPELIEEQMSENESEDETDSEPENE